jgi:hypothetical protein
MTIRKHSPFRIPATVHRSAPERRLQIVQPVPASALDRLDAVLRQHFHAPDTQAIRVVMSTIKSHYLNLGDPAWVFVVAPPGSGKTTTTIMGAAGLPQVQILGAWSASTFLSGMHGAVQPGLLEKLGPTFETNKCFVTKGDGILISKDFTTVLAMQRDRRAEILSQLREIHDGQYRKDFGTGVTKIWCGRITIIAAVTPALDRAYSTASTLGERFLQVRWHRPARVAGARAIDQQTAEKQISQDLTDAVRAVFDESASAVPEISSAARDNLAAVADLVAIGRTHVYRASFGGGRSKMFPSRRRTPAYRRDSRRSRGVMRRYNARARWTTMFFRTCTGWRWIVFRPCGGTFSRRYWPSARFPPAPPTLAPWKTCRS